MARSIITLSGLSKLPLGGYLAASSSPNFTGWAEQSRLNKTLSIVLLSVLVATIGTIVYLAVTPHIGERFTEFYILGLESKAEDYPTEVMPGEEATVILGIVNREYETTSYRVEVKIDRVINKEIGPLVLAHEEKWEQEVSFTPTRVGENQKVEFVLYKDGQEEPSLTLRLWINVARSVSNKANS